MDLLVSLVLGGVISYLLFLFWTGIGRHYYNMSEKMSQLERAGLFERVIAELLEKTTPAGVAYTTVNPGTGQTLSVQSFEAAVPPGRLRWSDRVFVFRYLPEDKRLVGWPTTLGAFGVQASQSQAEQLLPEKLLSLPLMEQAKGFRTWEDVTEFTAERPAGPSALRVTATFEHQGVRQNRHHYKSDRLYPIWNDFEP